MRTNQVFFFTNPNINYRKLLFLKKHFSLIIRIICFVIIQPLYNNLSAQIPPLDSLIQIVVSNNTTELTNQNQLLKQYRDKSWINLVPNLGYDPITNRPIVTLNISQALGFVNSKRQIKYRQATNAINYANSLTADTIKLKAEYYKLQNLISQYNEVSAQLKYDSLYIAIKKNENKNLQATATELLRAQQTRDENQTKLYNVKNQLISQKLVLEQIIKKELPLIVPILNF